jgi:hypothetical protein
MKASEQRIVFTRRIGAVLSLGILSPSGVNHLADGIPSLRSVSLDGDGLMSR